KTTFLLAIERFFSSERKRMVKEDFNDTGSPITVTVVLCEEGQADRKITCEWKYDEGKQSVLSPKYRSGGQELSKPGNALGGISVVYVPAEHETDDDGEDKKNTLWQKMIDGALRGKAKLDDDKKALQKKIETLYGKRLEEIRDRINAKMSGKEGVGYAPNTRVSLKFAEPDVTMPTSLKVSDLDSEREVDHKYAGHGTKRAFYMSTLEVISEMSADGSGGQPESSTVIVIDEPELHQHPQRQKVLLKALQRLSKQGSHQVVYSTHSPHFVTLKTPMSVRRVEREAGNVRVYDGKSLGEAQVRGRVIRAMEEAVFANGVILVEGYTDEVILGSIFRKASHKGNNVMETLIKNEVVVAECGGKPHITQFCDVLDSLGIGRFVLWDGDLHQTKKKAIENTRRLNEGIVERLGLDPGFLDRLARSGDDGYVQDGDSVCFKFDGPTCLVGCFRRNHAKELEADIVRGKDLDADLDLPTLEKTGFLGDVIPAIHARFAKRDGDTARKPARGAP
ncbi:MAG: hypothetical protein EB824_05295, partial [Thaumarchaeota archaeon S15]